MRGIIALFYLLATPSSALLPSLPAFKVSVPKSATKAAVPPPLRSSTQDIEIQLSQDQCALTPPGYGFDAGAERIMKEGGTTGYINAFVDEVRIYDDELFPSFLVVVDSTASRGANDGSEERSDEFRNLHL